ncbi:hypothetical protein MUK42_10137 [Musa troglodytarum]|uniref:Uncharacterized protein n=1 Tax=Musa troglodytarum TaxID=320322 RepID=A0A9E7JFE6_9LILI|nr:hypothetical protein MUK42_10137 [Musa troglodytarum]
MHPLDSNFSVDRPVVAAATAARLCIECRLFPLNRQVDISMIDYCRCSNNTPPVEERGPRIVCFFLSEAPSALSQPSSPFLPALTTTFSSLRRHLALFSLSRWLSLWSPTSTATSSFGGCNPSVVGRPPSIRTITGGERHQEEAGGDSHTLLFPKRWLFSDRGYPASFTI